jgi:serine/threonine-protein kinase
VRIVADAAAGLHAAHTLRTATGEALHVVHRDVSPQNLLVAYEGHVKVVDFGIAYAAERLSRTEVGTLKGKIPYMSPEQAAGEPVDARSDVFALGTVLYEAVTLTRLFRQDTEMATLLAVRAADVAPPRSRNPAVPVELERIILKALARRPEDRFATALELSERLEAVLRPVGEAASRTRLAEALETLLGDRRRVREAQIRSALATPTLGPLPAVVGDGTSSSLRVAAAAQPAAGRVPRALAIAAVIALVALAGLLAGRLLGQRPVPAPAGAPVATVPADPARPPAPSAPVARPEALVPGKEPGLPARGASLPEVRTVPAPVPPAGTRRPEMRPRSRAKPMTTLLELDRPTPPPPPAMRPRPRARLLDL